MTHIVISHERQRGTGRLGKDWLRTYASDLLSETAARLLTN